MRAVIVSRLCAGQSIKLIMNFANIKKGGVEDRGFGLPAHLTATLWTILCGASPAPRNKTEDLVKKIKEVMGYLDKHTVAKACRRFRSRIQALVAADGDFIE